MKADIEGEAYGAEVGQSITLDYVWASDSIGKSCHVEPEFSRLCGFTVINYNTSAQTARCVASLLQCEEPPAWILILDNASTHADFEQLQKRISHSADTEVRLFRSQQNLGFAAGSNFLVDLLIAESRCQYIGLLNSDAVAMPTLTGALMDALQIGSAMTGMAGGRVHKLDNPNEVDTLGISLYGSLMPADRKATTDKYLGPTGGCCLMTRGFVDDVKVTTGYLFDSRYFCYCEDTDLALRANLLGYCPAYTDCIVALHEGQASSGKVETNLFIAYHGIRNTIWMHLKLVPTTILFKHGPLLIIAHALTIFRYLMEGHFATLNSVYSDAFRIFPNILRERRKLKKNWRLSSAEIAKLITPRFYRQGYFKIRILGVLNSLKRRKKKAFSN